MKNIVFLVLIISILFPQNSFAQNVNSNTSLQNEALVRLISSLLEQIKILQAKLDQKKLEVKVENLEQTEYKREVAPLNERLIEVDERIDFLKERIIQKECVDPYWTASGEKRTFRCRDKDGVVKKTSKEITKLKEELADLEEEKVDLNEDIKNLRNKYGL